MAIIGKIRDNSWILVVLVGLGVLGFIVLSVQSQNLPGVNNGQSDLGKVAGQSISNIQLERAYSLLYGNNSTSDTYGARNYLWNYFVEEAILNKEADATGLGVCPTELKELEFGPNPSRIIVQRFGNPNAPGQVDRTQLDQIRDLIESDGIQDAIDAGQLSPSFVAYWRHQQDEIMKDRLQTKVNNIVAKGMYTPNWMAEMTYADENQTANVAFVKVPFSDVDNSAVSVSDADYSNYLAANAGRYETKEETRYIDYAVFTVTPSAQDSAKNRQVIADAIADFAKEENDSTFIARYDGTFDVAYVTKDKLSKVLADTLFNADKGSVFGPYLEGKDYKAVKVVDKMVVADSVRSRHILRPVQTRAQLVEAQNTLDSLKTLIENGQATFEELAQTFGTDATASKGGDLGFTAQGGMVKPFNDLIFFQAKKGELKIVGTQFGLHLVEVTDTKFETNTEALRLAYINEPILAGDETKTAVYAKASEFVGKNTSISAFTQNAPAMGLTVEATTGLKGSDYRIGNLGNDGDGRKMVRWAYTADAGEVSPEIYEFKSANSYFTDKYVVAALKSVQAAGVPAVDNIKSAIEPQVLNEKKGEYLAQQMQGMDMNAIAAKYSVRVDSLSGISFANAQSLGSEAVVIGEALKLQNGQATAPIVGKTGVYVVQMLNKANMAAPTSLSQYKTRNNQRDRSRVSNRVINAMKDNETIVDNRSKLF